jgi:hypothetical protein
MSGTSVEYDMKATAEIIQLRKKEEAKFICSACGADRGCNCNAPAVEKAARIVEQQRQASKAYRARKAEEKQQPRHMTTERTGLDGKIRKLPEKKPEPEEEVARDRRTCSALDPSAKEAERLRVDYQPANPLAAQFRAHLTAASRILKSKDWQPSDMTSQERELLWKLENNLDYEVITFEKMLDLCKWPIKPSEEHRKRAAELQERAKALGLTMQKKGRQYEMRKDNSVTLLALDEVSNYLDQQRDLTEGKLYVQYQSFCGDREMYEESNKQRREKALAKNPDAKPLWVAR